MRRFCYNINVVANAAVAQLVEHMLGKHEVTSSTLVSSSKIPHENAGFLFCKQKAPRWLSRRGIFCKTKTPP